MFEDIVFSHEILQNIHSTFKKCGLASAALFAMIIFGSFPCTRVISCFPLVFTYGNSCICGCLVGSEFYWFMLALIFHFSIS